MKATLNEALAAAQILIVNNRATAFIFCEDDGTGYFTYLDKDASNARTVGSIDMNGHAFYAETATDEEVRALRAMMSPNVQTERMRMETPKGKEVNALTEVMGILANRYDQPTVKLDETNPHYVKDEPTQVLTWVRASDLEAGDTLEDDRQVVSPYDGKYVTFSIPGESYDEQDYRCAPDHAFQVWRPIKPDTRTLADGSEWELRGIGWYKTFPTSQEPPMNGKAMDLHAEALRENALMQGSRR